MKKLEEKSNSAFEKLQTQINLLTSKVIEATTMIDKKINSVYGIGESFKTRVNEKFSTSSFK